MAFLRFDTGPQTGDRVPLDKDKITFGRGKNCDHVLAHPTVSREHFYIERNNDKLFLVDQGSVNGTLANGARVSWVELNDGDSIQAGPFLLVVEMGEQRTETVELPAMGDPVKDEYAAASGYAPQYLQGIEHFNAGRYFDAHEVWEEIWLHESGDTKVFYQMLIQAAVGLHHYERGNERGASGMRDNVVEKLSRLPAVFMSLDLVEFSDAFKAYISEPIEADAEAMIEKQKRRPHIILLSHDEADWGS